jgi:hypothetical protein
MAVALQERIDKIMVKAGLLTERYDLMKQEKLAADQRIEELSAELDKARREIDGLQRQIEYLKVASIAVPDHREVEKARSFISGLVREIDDCISQLSQ